MNFLSKLICDLMLALNFLCVQHVNYLQAFWLFQFSSSQIEMVNNYEVHVIFQDIEHQLQESILHHFSQYRFFFFFFEIFIKLRINYLWCTQNFSLEFFATLSIHISHLHPHIEEMAILYFNHNLSYICYYSFAHWWKNDISLL